jgi:predicted ATPase
VLRYFCSPFYVHSALHPVLDQLEGAAQLKKSDPPEVKLDKLEALLRQGTSRVARAAALLAPLLSIPTGERYPELDIAPERKKTLALEALLEQVAGLASQPVLIILEDAHWIDPTSAELFQLIIDRIQRMPVLVLIAYRPGFTPPWTAFPHVTSLSLAHLSHRQAAALVEKVTRGRKLPPEVLEHIVTRTDGVPLYAEELTKTLLDSGALELVGDTFRLSRPLPSLSIPESLHDSLMARLDRLSDGKDVAHLAATLGRVFNHDLLAAVSTLDEAALQHALEQLVEAELIYRRGAPPEAIYEFKHALVQDAAYGTLLKSRRQQLHARVAQFLEQRFPETAETQPELLAHHCTQGGFIEKAVDYWHKAGLQAMARSAIVEAVAQLTQALGLLIDLPVGPNRDRKELDLQIAWGAALISTKGWAAPEVGKTYARARELCTEEAHFPQLLAALSGLFAHHLHRSSKQVALQIADELLRLAEQRQDRPARAASHRFLGVTLLFNGQLLLASKHFESFFALYSVTGLFFTALIMLFQGYPDRAVVRSREALAAAYELGHTYTTSQTLYLSCWLHQIRGEQQIVLKRATALGELATESGLSSRGAEGTIFGGWGAPAARPSPVSARSVKTWRREAILP